MTVTVLLEGNGHFDFRVQKGRIEYDTIANVISDIPADGLCMDCVALICFDDRAVHAFGYGVEAGIIVKDAQPVKAGWFGTKFCRQYRDEAMLIGIDADSAVMCMGRLCGGAEVQYKKGSQRMSFSLRLDLAWPLRVTEDWFPAVAPYLRSIGKLG